MDGGFGSDLITISDEEGNEYVLEHVDTFEAYDTFYMLFTPTDIDEDDEKYGMLILKVVNEDGEDILVTIDDDNEMQDVYDRYMAQIFDEEKNEK